MFSLRSTVVSMLLLMVASSDATISVIDQYGRHLKSFMDKEALFSIVLTNAVKGLVVLSDPPNACEKIAEPHFFTNSTVLRFVLINGTSSRECLSLVKARNAEKAGFDLAIIFGIDIWQPGIFFNKPEVSIPVRYISYMDGVTIKNEFLYNNLSEEVNFLIVNPIPDDIGYYITLFSIVIGICLIIMVLFMICLLIKCIQERRRNRRNRLSSRQIRQLPTEVFKTGDHYDICAICLEHYKEGDKLRILPCSHAYHKRCVDTWLMENRRNCPLCKRKVRFGDSSSDSDTDSILTSPAEDTPLIGSSERRPLFGTFVASSSADCATGSAERYQVLIAEHSDSGTMASNEGSINSLDGADSGEFFSCNVLSESPSAVASPDHRDPVA